MLKCQTRCEAGTESHRSLDEMAGLHILIRTSFVHFNYIQLKGLFKCIILN